MTLRILLILFAGLAVMPTVSQAADPAPLLARIRAVKPEGNGNAEASRAWRELVAQGGEALLPTLLAFDGADETAANWLRTAVETIAERERSAGRLQGQALETYLGQKGHAPVGRRLAYEWLCRLDKNAPSRLLPGMLNDTSIEIRRDAIALALAEAETLGKAGKQDSAKTQYRKILSSARDKDQVDRIARELKKLGEEVDLASHFGFIRRWSIIGPFDNTGGKGYASVFDPERAINLQGSLKGKDGQLVSWKSTESTDPGGLMDVNKAVMEAKGVAAYAYTEVESPVQRAIEIRAATKNAVKIFFNGRLVYAKEEYHHGKYTDQHVARVTLNAGKNTLLVKICQNEQMESWTKEWDFHLRICDELGGAVPVKVVTPTSEEKKR